MMTLALSVEALLFRYHLHGRTDFDVHLHTLLLYAVYAAILSCLAEMRYPDRPLIALSRALFVLLQGTWFWQVGFILYNPLSESVSWGNDDMMLATTLYVVHLACGLLLLLGVGVVIGTLQRCTARRGWSREKESDQQQLLDEEQRQDEDGLNSDSQL